ncbi:MAG: succinate dehydrogenase, hydrophobic membrane anchor protein [Armatimonadota bacterium]|nr:succinate dehydrogenase, hydrophobic membrane anchor protein [Armatimonadota bacterium]MDR7487106.1 succinate dehydrogenase, hydrophobic membrane anchor protein [Armatimonadota bacterium]MDR7534140.1 succinate dehydrogenase, hydrophobic membrane anchor protein [Armatimonadota bacterium]MDR7535826.1 succinate dehydrogenase, hydrophobic membrane anchor protein [Armatimonadota bacterium]
MIARPTSRGVRPSGGLPLYLWFYMRVSAVAMLGLVIGHLYIMHVINSTDTIDFQFVAQRFRGPFWRAYDLLILLFALSHGLIGLRGILDDYIHHRGWRVAAEIALWIVGAAFAGLGALVLFTLQFPSGA